VVLGDFAGGPLSCGGLFDAGGGAVGQLVALELLETDLITPVGVGSYTVVPLPSGNFSTDGGIAVVIFGEAHADAGVPLANGVSGVVNLTQLDVGVSASGNFTAALVASDGGNPIGTLSGSFDATWCGPAN
jgi:hypothetical protein